ncbi:uncharacterized protein [Rutidosis leptorrhynchoides]|uniref:uncharacterized protein n=1 Tax=Rutidosis leptorrhynchoides TaxID=125765 RepID=UPI003A998D61
MNLTQSPFSSSSDDDAGTMTTTQQSAGRSQLSGDSGNSLSMGPTGGSRHWRDVFWLGVFLLHLIIVGFALGLIGYNNFRKKDRLNIEHHMFFEIHVEIQDLTEDYWRLYAIAAASSTAIGWIWLLLLGSYSDLMMRVSVHILTTYLAVLSVLCFWRKSVFLGVTFAIGSGLQFLYIISVIDRLPFTMLVLQRAVKMVWKLPEVTRIACAFMLAMLLWLALWSFGAAGVVASGTGDGGQWWYLVVFSVSLFWTGAVLCNTVHVIVSGMVFLVLINDGRESTSMPRDPLLQTLRYAVTTSFGSICYGSLFTAAIRTLRWEIRGLRSKIGNNECLLCCVDFLFHLVETLVRFFNKYAYVQIAVYGKNFNNSARDAWELFQSTGVETLVAYDCSGAVLLMGTLLGGLITGTCAVVLTEIARSDRDIMIGSTAILMGMVLVGLAMVVVESAVTSIYICYAEDPLLIQRWDPEFFTQMSEMLHQRLQYRSARVREGLNQNRLSDYNQENIIPI